MKTFAKVLAYILVVLLVAGAIGLIYKFTNGFNEDFKTFYVEYDGNMVTSDTEKGLSIERELRFDVKYTFDKLDGNAEKKEYKLKVVPNVTDETNFEFTVDGGTHSFKKEAGKDFSKCFDINKSDTYFTVTLHADTTMQTVLEKAYEGKTVEVPETVDLRGKCYFTLEVSSYNGKSQVNIPFRIDTATLVLYPDNFVF